MLVLLLLPGAALAQERVSGPFLAARQALLANDFGAARPYLIDVLAQDPANPVLLEQATQVHLALGDIPAAAGFAARMEAVGAQSQTARIARIADLLGRGERAAALAEIEAGSGIGPLVDGLLRAWLKVDGGRMAEALAAFDDLAGMQGMQAFGLYHKALALAHVGDDEGAHAILGGGAAGPLQLTRRGTVAHIQILTRLEEWEAAAQRIETAFGRDPDPEVAALRAAVEKRVPLEFDTIRSATDGLADVFFDVASTLQGDASDLYTLIHARVAQHLRPDHTRAALLSGRLLDALQQPELAIGVYAAIPPGDPLHHHAETARAEALYRADRTEEARAVLEALTESHGHLATVHITLGDLLRRDSEFEAASAAYDAAIDLLGPPEPQHWVVYYTRAITRERSGRWPEAEADFRQALALNPDQPHVLNYLGYSLVEQRSNLDEALEMIERAVAGEPDNGYITDSLGWVLYRLGRYQEAVPYMERAAELLPVDPIVNDHLGDVYWAVGRRMEARFQWRRALSFGPADDLDMDRIRAKLEVGLDQVLIDEGQEPHHPDLVHAN